MHAYDAIKLAFSLGQTYADEANSYSYAANKRSDKTLDEFRALRDSFLDDARGTPAPALDESAIRASERERIARWFDEKECPSIARDVRTLP